MSHFLYLALLAGCLGAPIGLELTLHIGLLTRWRRLVATVIPVLVVFTAWDGLAVHARQWTYGRHWITGAFVFGLPIEELAFFAVVPLCAIATLEAVRRRRPNWLIGDEA